MPRITIEPGLLSRLRFQAPAGIPQQGSGVQQALKTGNPLDKAMSAFTGGQGGGSPIDAWEPGAFYEPTQSHPWDDAIVRARVAVRTGVLKGILWHQGESDSTAALAPGYAAKLRRLIARFRAELNAPDLPFIVGQLGEFKDAPWDDARRTVDRAHQELPASIPRTGFVSARGLTDRGDKIHFDSASYREFGKRYFEVFQRVTSGG